MESTSGASVFFKKRESEECVTVPSGLNRENSSSPFTLRWASRILMNFSISPRSSEPWTAFCVVRKTFSAFFHSLCSMSRVFSSANWCNILVLRYNWMARERPNIAMIPPTSQRMGLKCIFIRSYP
jgi:hypothetical protein